MVFGHCHCTLLIEYRGYKLLNTDIQVDVQVQLKLQVLLRPVTINVKTIRPIPENIRLCYLLPPIPSKRLETCKPRIPFHA